VCVCVCVCVCACVCVFVFVFVFVFVCETHWSSEISNSRVINLEARMIP
jgi:hypothetical protein